MACDEARLVSPDAARPFVNPDGLEPLDDSAKRDELLHRTPGYFSAQGDPWPVHCDDFCALLGSLKPSAVVALASELEGDLQTLQASLRLSRVELIAELSRDASPLWAHLFRCLSCGQQRVVAEYE